ncbi:MAG TPA: hypothetical protein VJZ00_04340 [Thermoanaerobaculia bacterium]|nr:hypothetical protein [Thermoanaerobaculia bacterium]
MRRFVALALALALTFVLGAQVFAADRRKIATLNVGATALVTLASCAIQKHLRVVRCLTAGAIAGTAFYQAKRLAGRGDITEGWLVANAANSLIENTTAGEHPLSRIGYTFGPLRIRVATPFDRSRESLADVDLSAAETGYLLQAFADADDVDIRDGMLWYETRDPERGEGGVVFHGYTWGIFPGVWSGAETHTWRHEAVHAVQALQLDAPEPPVLTLDRERRLFRVRYLRAGALNVADNVTTAQQEYANRWEEIEAYRFAEDRKPPQ